MTLTADSKQTPNPSRAMKIPSFKDSWSRLEQGKAGWILLWLLGIPIPILLILFLLRGCT